MLLRYKCDWFNVLRALTAPFIFLYPFFFGFSEGYVLITALILWGMLNDINHVLHLHIHHEFSHNKYFNILLDVCMGIVTGMVASNWRIQHKYGHHQRGLGVTNAENSWEMGTPWEMKEYTIWAAIYHSVRTTFPTFYLPLAESFKKGIIGNATSPINYRYAFIEQMLFIAFVLAMLWVNPFLTLAYMLPWYFLVYFVTRYIDYLNHFSCSDGKFDSSNNSLNVWYNRLGCNFGYHSAHHYKPGAHWSLLPEIFADIRPNIPEKNIKHYSWSGFLLPYHFYLRIKGKM